MAFLPLILNSQVDQIHTQFTQFSTQHACVQQIVPMQTSTPYKHLHVPSLDTSRQHSHPDPPRRDDDWRQPDSSSCSVPPRAELTKFDDTNLVEWLDDCEYYFCTSHTPEFYMVRTVIPSLVGEAHE
jgi:hypothetical protein